VTEYERISLTMQGLTLHTLTLLLAVAADGKDLSPDFREVMGRLRDAAGLAADAAAKAGIG